jgi:hypothetical protein
MVDRVRHVNRLRTCAAVFGVAFASGCGGSDGPARPALPAQSRAAAAAEIRQVVDRANSTFATGRYKRTCSYYTAPMQRLLTSTIGGATCAAAEKRAAAQLRQSVSRAQLDAIARYGVATVDVDKHGLFALAHYGELPRRLAGVPGLTPRASLRMQRIRGHWLIASLPF